MAKRYDPKSQDYPETLGVAPDERNPLANQYYGFGDDQIQQMKKAGITVGDLQNMGIHDPVSYENAIGGRQITGTGREQLKTAAMLKASLASSAAQMQQQQQAASQPAQGQSYLGPQSIGYTQGSGASGLLGSVPMNRPNPQAGMLGPGLSASGALAGTTPPSGFQGLPKGYNPYNMSQPPPLPSIQAMSDLAAQPPLVQPLGNTNLGQVTNRQGGSFLS